MPDLLRLHEQLARVVLVGRDLSEILSEITGIAGRATPNAETASITLLRGEKAFTGAYDSQMALAADELQFEHGYGPCLDAAQAGQVLVIDDMGAEQRWPDYARQAAAHGIGASLSVPLPFQTTMIGALNVYSRRPCAFGDRDRTLVQEIACWVALAVSNADAAGQTSRTLAHLQEAMKSRAVIEQAKGILMERHKVTEDQAFGVLSRASQESNVKLRDVAAELVSTGAMPEAP